MNIFAIVAVLVVVAIGAWWIGASPDESKVEIETQERTESTETEAEGRLVPPNTEVTPPPSNETTDPNTGNSIEIYGGISVSEGTTVLNLSNRNLSGSLKGELRFLTNLTELNLSGNNFTNLPAEVGQLSKLEVLNLSNNPLTGLPQELGNLKNLKILDLRGTQYAAQDLAIIKNGLSASTQILVD